MGQGSNWADVFEPTRHLGAVSAERPPTNLEREAQALATGGAGARRAAFHPPRPSSVEEGPAEPESGGPISQRPAQRAQIGTSHRRTSSRASQRSVLTWLWLLLLVILFLWIVLALAGALVGVVVANLLASAS